MAFTPRLEDDIFMSLVARVVEQSELTDIVPGSALTHLLRAFAREIERTEFRILDQKNAFNFAAATGTDLDDRLLDFPPAGLGRLGAQFASGDSMRVVLTVTGEDQIVPAGTLYTRTDNRAIQYTQLEDVLIDKDWEDLDENGVGTGVVTFPSDDTTPGIRVACTTAGVDGNCAPNLIDVCLTVPENFVSCTNIFVVSGGAEEETDTTLINRAKHFLAGLSRITASGLKSVALSFRALPTNPGDPVTRFRHVSVYEPPDVPGYTEVLVDPGGGGFEEGRPRVESAFVLLGNQRVYQWPHQTMHPPVLFHDAPAVDPLDESNIYIAWAWDGEGFDANVTQWMNMDSPDVKRYYGIPNDYSVVVSIPERGILYLDPNYPIAEAPGTSPDIPVTLRIGGPNADYYKYVGAVAEFQALIEGDPDNPVLFPGYRPAGGRIRVTLPEIQYINSITADITAAADVVLPDLRILIVSEIMFLIDDLSPGEPLLRAEIIRRVMGVTGVLNVSLEHPIRDVYPSQENRVLRANVNVIELI